MPYGQDFPEIIQFPFFGLQNSSEDTNTCNSMLQNSPLLCLLSSGPRHLVPKKTAHRNTPMTSSVGELQQSQEVCNWQENLGKDGLVLQLEKET